MGGVGKEEGRIEEEERKTETGERKYCVLDAILVSGNTKMNKTA